MSTEDILNEREKTHGDFELVSEFRIKIALLVKEFFDEHGIVLHSKLNPSQLNAVNNIIMKICRIYCGDPNHADHWDDIAGYAMLGKGKKTAQCSCFKAGIHTIMCQECVKEQSVMFHVKQRRRNEFI